MALYQQLISSIAVLAGLIGLAMFLRWIGIIKEEDGQIFSKLVTQITLPALIFVSLAKTSIDWSEGFLVLIMFVAEISSLGTRLGVGPVDEAIWSSARRFHVGLRLWEFIVTRLRTDQPGIPGKCSSIN